MGDASLGEWVHWTGRALHIRRRLTPSEQVPIGPVQDIRGTPEARTRIERVLRVNPHILRLPDAAQALHEELYGHTATTS